MNKSLNIVFISPGGVDRSGQYKVIPHILWMLEKLTVKHKVTVISLYQYEQACEYTLCGARIISPGKIRQDWNNFQDPQSALKEMYEKTLDIVSSEGTPDILHGFWGFHAGWLASRIALSMKIPSVVSLMGAEFVAFPEIKYGGQFHTNQKMILNDTLKQATSFTVASHHMEVHASEFGVSAEYIPFGVHGSCFKPNKSPAQPPWKLLHVASINRIKDQATLLKAFRRVVDRIPAVHLDIVGEDTLNGELQNLTDELDMENHVTFHGYLPNNEVRIFFQNANIYLVSSLNETGPISMLEAAACRVPTVGTEVGYVADWTDKRALAAEIGNSQDLAEKIIFLLKNNQKRKELGEAAYNWVREYDSSWTTNKLLETYKSLMY